MTKLLLAVAVLVPALASAQVRHNGTIDHREHHQTSRIHQGVKNGSLTRWEAARLRAREAAIRAQERRDRRDGHGFSRYERTRLQHRLNRTSRDLHQQKHDGQHRPH